jgi:hypothetical protein
MVLSACSLTPCIVLVILAARGTLRFELLLGILGAVMLLLVLTRHQHAGLRAASGVRQVRPHLSDTTVNGFGVGRGELSISWSSSDNKWDLVSPGYGLLCCFALGTFSSVMLVDGLWGSGERWAGSGLPRGASFGAGRGGSRGGGRGGPEPGPVRGSGLVGSSGG